MKTLGKFHSEKGAAAVEFALLLPLLMIFRMRKEPFHA